ncbi:uncharacterized protein LOC115221203 [Argonauta hians]
MEMDILSSRLVPKTVPQLQILSLFTLNSSEYFKNVLYRSFSWIYSSSLHSLNANLVVQHNQGRGQTSEGPLSKSDGNTGCPPLESSLLTVDVTREGRLSYIAAADRYHSGATNSLSPVHTEQMASNAASFPSEESQTPPPKSCGSMRWDVTPVKGGNSFSKAGYYEENENKPKGKRSRYSPELKTSHRHHSSPKLHSYQRISSNPSKRRRRHTYSTSSSSLKEDGASCMFDSPDSSKVISQDYSASLFVSPISSSRDSSSTEYMSPSPNATHIKFSSSTPLSVRRPGSGNHGSSSSSRSWKSENYISQHRVQWMCKSKLGTPQYCRWRNPCKKLSESFPMSRSVEDSMYSSSSNDSSRGSTGCCGSSGSGNVSNNSHRVYSSYKNWKQLFQQRCSGLTNSFIDSHCHIDFLFNRLPFKGSFRKYREENADTFPANYAGCVAVFCEPKSFIPDGGLWRSLDNESDVWVAMGCHPKNVESFDSAAEKALSECIEQPKVVAVGEIGLDYSGRFWETAPLQKKVFIHQIKLALSVQKPLVIHCRDAQQDCLHILKKYVPVDYRIHCHCFTKSFKEAQEWLSYFPNLYIGLTPLVTYPSALEVHNTASKIPLNRLLLETDAPYFVPRLVPRGTMKFSHPGLAIAVAFEVAQLKNVVVDVVLKHCLQNTKTMYGI